MTTLVTLIALTAVLYLIVRHENKPTMQPIRIRHDENQPRRMQRRR